MIDNLNVKWGIAPKDYTSAAGTDKYMCLAGYDRMLIVIQTGAWAAGTAAVTLLQATDTSAGGEKALGFSYQSNDVSASGTLVKTAVTANTFNLATANKIFVIEVRADFLDMAGGFDCVSVHVASPGANADLYGVIYILGDARKAPVS